MTRTAIADNGDADGFADESETATMTIEVSNKSGQALSGVVARLARANADPDVDCITDTVVEIGSLAVDETRFITDDSFEFRVADNVRDTSPAGDDDSIAKFVVTIDSDLFDNVNRPQEVAIDLDLDATGGSGPFVFTEDFEVGILGGFTTMDLGSPISSIDGTGANGFRCQYHDPDWLNSQSFGLIDDCFPNPTGAPPAYHWQTTDNRAFEGSRSLFYGIELGDPQGTTTPMARLEAVRQQDPINLGWDRICSVTRTTACINDGDCPSGETCNFAAPRLTFKHQISFVDTRSVNAEPGEAADRGVVMLQLADAAGIGVGDWIKLQPIVNVYDQQGSNNFFQCTFDPIDDGSSEDDFFDPFDPQRNTGPSSTCFPEFIWAYVGDTDGPFSPTALGNASDGPGLAGNTGVGTWVESEVDLTRFRGRRVRLRFLTSALKVGPFPNYEALFGFNPNPGDDGWWIDDLRVDDALAIPAAVSEDSDDATNLPGCGAGCTSIAASLLANPAQLGAPGQVVELDAGDSAATPDCADGILQYAFFVDVNGNGVPGDGSDILLRGFNENPRFADAPSSNTQYAVAVRCGSIPSCSGAGVAAVAVNCPASAPFDTLGGPIRIDKAVFGSSTQTISWPLATAGAGIPFVRGDLAAVSSLTTNGSGTANGDSLDVSADLPGPGSGLYYLLRGEGRFCNENSWTSGGSGEADTPGRDAVLP